MNHQFTGMEIFWKVQEEPFIHDISYHIESLPYYLATVSHYRTSSVAGRLPKYVINYRTLWIPLPKPYHLDTVFTVLLWQLDSP